jgi:hypothetical protein
MSDLSAIAAAISHYYKNNGTFWLGKSRTEEEVIAIKELIEFIPDLPSIEIRSTKSDSSQALHYPTATEINSIVNSREQCRSLHNSMIPYNYGGPKYNKIG